MPSTIQTTLLARALARSAHELCHLAAALLVGCPRRWILTASNVWGIMTGTCVTLPRAESRAERFIEASGWLGSLLIATIVTAHCRSLAFALGFWWAALDAISSDLLAVGGEAYATNIYRSYRCGNFGLILLSPEHREKVTAILRTMVQVVRRRSPPTQPHNPD